jgi:hypothetical protein
MEFDRIFFNGKQVELDYSEATAGGAKAVVKEQGTEPSPKFKSALQAFATYVGWVISAPESWADSITVRGVSIKRHDDQPRGIVVTALRPCQRARNGTMLINTPYLHEAPPEYAGDYTGLLPKYIPELIDDLEEAATLYHEGERGEQMNLNLPASENAKAVNERMAGAEVASTRKPRAKKDPNAHTPAIHQVQNPDATEILTNDRLRQLLLTVERDVPVDAIALWTSSERSLAEAWGRARQKELAGEYEKLAPEARGKMVPAEPACVIKYATLPLKAEEWSAPAPPKAAGVTPLAVH